MQLWRLLRGMALAYLVLVFVVWLVLKEQDFEVPSEYVPFLMIGLSVWVPILVLTIVLWLFLVWIGATVPWWLAPPFGAVLAVVSMAGWSASARAGMDTLVITLVAGACYGLVAWVGAFGLRARERMTWRMARSA